MRPCVSKILESAKVDVQRIVEAMKASLLPVRAMRQQTPYTPGVMSLLLRAEPRYRDI